MYYIKLHNNQKLHRYLLLALWGTFAGQIINTALAWVNALYLGDAVYNPMQMQQHLGFALFTGLISMIVSLVNLAFPILFLVWFFRAYENLQKINPALPEHALGWTIGAWFVPILNFIRPFTMMAEVWNKTQRAMRAEGEQYTHEPQTPLNWWWGCWIGTFVVAIVSLFVAMNTMTSRIISSRNFQAINQEDIASEMMKTTLIINLILTAIGLISLFFLSKALKRLVVFEDELAGRVDRSGYGQWGTQQQQYNWNQQ